MDSKYYSETLANFYLSTWPHMLMELDIIIAVRRTNKKKLWAFALKFVNKINVDFFLFTAEQMEGYCESLFTALYCHRS
jgi:hypothetical protein